ncbi:MAG: UDP-N-acetylmuramoyl-tripeptide--D-alanyl-D-alanine ligase [Burkholderiaceae bacterium]
MMTLQQALAWLPGARAVGDLSTAICRVHTDTRSVQPGDLFVALKGERYDANHYLAQARAGGAAGAICHADVGLEATGMPGLEVTDTRRALGVLGAAWRAQFHLPLIAVTGSNGKTTVTQMLASILRAFKPGRMLATQGNFNNDIGVPLTLLRLRREHEIAVLELGMNHPGEIALLAGMAGPSVALVNNAQREHLEFMVSLDAVARENGAVLSALPADGMAVFPHGDAFTPLWQALAGARRQLRFALQAPDASVAQPNRPEVFCTRAQWRAGAWQVAAHTPAGDVSFALQVAGRHNVGNALAALACALAAGVPLDDIALGLEAFSPIKGRSRSSEIRLGTRSITLVDDSYNANPDSVHAALEMLAGLPGPRLLVLGDMAEVGDEGPLFHAQALAHGHALGIESLFTLGALCSTAAGSSPHTRHFDAMPELIAAVREQLPHTRSVLVKGSRLMQMERVVQAIEQRTEQAASDAAPPKQETPCC